MTTSIFVISLIAFIAITICTTIFLCLWIYRDAEVKSEQEPSLWVLVLIFMNPLGLIIYFLVGRQKKDVPAPGTHKTAAIVCSVLFVIALVFFIFSTVNFAQNSDFGFGANTTMNSGFWSGRSTNYRDNVWAESTRRGNGRSRRNHSFNAQQLQNFHIDSENSEGNLFLDIQQGDTLLRIDITGDFHRGVDLLNYGFEPGRIRLTLVYQNVRNSETIISW